MATKDEIKIMQAALSDGMPQMLASFIVAQSKHETGNYSHRFYKVGNNAFGYSYSKGSKWQLDKGGSLADNGIPIAQYRNVEDSVHELTSWIKRRQKEKKFPANLNSIMTANRYAELLKNAGYYQDTLFNYSSGLLNALKSLSGELYKLSSGNPLLIIAFIISFIAIIYLLNI